MQGQINNTTNKTNMMKITKLTSLAISAALAMAMTASAENSDKKGNRLEGKGKRSYLNASLKNSTPTVTAS